MALRPSGDIICDIKLDLMCVWVACPDILFIWSDIVERRAWHQAMSIDRIKKAKTQVNKEVSRFVK